MNSHFDAIRTVLGLGLEPKDLTFWQISLRGIIVFVATLIILRLGDKRFFSKRSAFDAALGFILASMLARAVNGSAAFFPTLGGALVLVGLHKLLAYLTCDWHWLGNRIKGHSALVVENGVVKKDAMRTHHLSEHDLMEDLHFNGNVSDLAKVKEAYYERNGQISVVKN